MRAILLGGVFCCASALAADVAPTRELGFGALDTNLDYFITEDEAARNPAAARNLKNMDLDGDGRLSPLEFNNLALALSVPPDPFPVGR